MNIWLEYSCSAVVSMFYPISLKDSFPRSVTSTIMEQGGMKGYMQYIWNQTFVKPLFLTELHDWKETIFKTSHKKCIVNWSPHKGIVKWGFDVDELLSKQCRCQWFETPWCSCDGIVVDCTKPNHVTSTVLATTVIQLDSGCYCVCILFCHYILLRGQSSSLCTLQIY